MLKYIMQNYYFTLDEKGAPVHEPDVKVWAKWMQEHGEGRISIRVGESFIGRAHVSTVFLGINHNFGEHAHSFPILWESMAFYADGKSDQRRCYGTRSDAVAMHQRMVTRARRHEPFYIRAAAFVARLFS